MSADRPNRIPYHNFVKVPLYHKPTRVNPRIGATLADRTKGHGQMSLWAILGTTSIIPLLLSLFIRYSSCMTALFFDFDRQICAVPKAPPIAKSPASEQTPQTPNTAENVGTFSLLPITAMATVQPSPAPAAHPLHRFIAPSQPLRDARDALRDPVKWWKHYVSKFRGTEIPSIGTPAPSLTVLIYTWLGAFIGIFAVALITYEAHVPALVRRFLDDMVPLVASHWFLYSDRLVWGHRGADLRGNRVSPGTTQKRLLWTNDFSILGCLCRSDDGSLGHVAGRDRLATCARGSGSRFRGNFSDAAHADYAPAGWCNGTYCCFHAVSVFSATVLYALDVHYLAGRVGMRRAPFHRAADREPWWKAISRVLVGTLSKARTSSGARGARGPEAGNGIDQAPRTHPAGCRDHRRHHGRRNENPTIC